MKRVVGWTLWLAAGCHASTAAVARDAGDAELALRDAWVSDARAVMDASDTGSTCTIVADEPRAIRLRGQVAYTRDVGAASPVTLTETRLLYLPRGRGPNAPLILGFGDYAGSFVEVSAMFDARAGVGDISFRGRDGSDVSWTASMSPPDGALALQITRNINTTTDVRDDRQGATTLCPDGDAPAPTLRPLIEVGPTGPWRFGASAPVAVGVDTIALRSNGVRVEVSGRWEAGWLALTPARSVAPGSEITLDLAGVRDPVGRVFSQEAPVRVLTTTEVVTDHTFDTAPPAGAVVGGRAETRGGALRLSSRTGRIGPYVSLVALGEWPAGRVTVRYQTAFARSETFTASLVRADGASVSLPIESGTAGDPIREAQASVEGNGPLWLQVTDRSATQRPGWIPSRLPVFVLDEVQAGE